MSFWKMLSKFIAGDKSQKVPFETLKLEKLENRQLLTVIIDDPSSSLRKAMDISIDSDDQNEFSFQSKIDKARDKDSYCFIAPADGLMSINMNSAVSRSFNALDPTLTVYDYKKRKIGFNDDISTFIQNANVDFYVHQGQQYYIKAQGWRSSFGDYELTITAPDGNSQLFDMPDDANKIKNAANIVSEGSKTEVFVGVYPAKDKDYFSYTAKSDSTLTITIDTSSSPLNSYLYVYNNRKKIVAKNLDKQATLESTVTIEVEKDQQFFIRVNGYKKSIGTYNLIIEETPANKPETTDPDNLDEGNSTNSNANDPDIQGYAVSFSAWDYPGRDNDIAGPKTDSYIIKKLLRDGFNFDTENIHINSGGANQVNANTVESEIGWLASKADSNDIAVIHYSGHGLEGDSISSDDEESLLLPDSTGIYQQDLERMIGSINPETTKIILIDSCFAGGLTDIANNIPNAYVLASAEYNQYAWDEVPPYYPSNNYNGGSIFMNWLAQGILSKDADANDNGMVSLFEAFNYTDQNVNLATGTGNDNQNPVIQSPITDLEILLA
ncbi:MAG: caspase family protein [Phycisphaerae bacterium]|nr:caspase family protein [Phycisphaerae bacterium]